MTRLCDLGARHLTRGILYRAVIDWYVARRALETFRDAGDDPATRHRYALKCAENREVVLHPESFIEDVERFLESPWFSDLYDLDGSALLDVMRGGEIVVFYRGGVRGYSPLPLPVRISYKKKRRKRT